MATKVVTSRQEVDLSEEILNVFSGPKRVMMPAHTLYLLLARDVSDFTEEEVGTALLTLVTSGKLSFGLEPREGDVEQPVDLYFRLPK